MNFFIADTHFFHQDLLGPNDFAPRLFDSVNAMNSALIAAWNARVDDNDVVYHLGDIAMNPENVPTDADVLAILTRLNGRIAFIKGNHDYNSLFKYLRRLDPGWHGQPKFSFHAVGTIIKDDHTQFIMTHYPLLLGITKQTLNLHGHIHHSMIPIAENINVGVDAPERAWLPAEVPWGSPLKASEIHELFQKKQETLKK
ncbi:MAG: metallophosphoesterase family protein [Lactobacillus sp.]|jgi:calcineurin-like phosphoesterase family protein|nr:metallophosphoesterase family protein [Lactobacillus sp.]MCI2033133.1 metallophosphoesterase family protein [Lactobacillus sp.]